MAPLYRNSERVSSPVTGSKDSPRNDEDETPAPVELSEMSSAKATMSDDGPQPIAIKGVVDDDDSDDYSSEASTSDTTNPTPDETPPAADEGGPGEEAGSANADGDEDDEDEEEEADSAAPGSVLLEEWTNYDGERGDNVYPRALEASAGSGGDEDGEGTEMLSPEERRQAIMLVQSPSTRRIVQRRMSSQQKSAAECVSDKKLFNKLQGKMRETGVKTEVGLAQLLSDPEKLKAVEDMVEKHKSREEAVKAFDESLEADLRSAAASAGIQLEAGFGRGGKGILGSITRGVGNLGASIMDAVPGGSSGQHRRRASNESEGSSVEPPAPALPAIGDGTSLEERDHEDGGPWWKMRPRRGSHYASDPAVPAKSAREEVGELLPKDSVAALLTGDRPYVHLPSRSDRESSLLEALMTAASGQDGPSLVSICGAPYVGKSRLLREILVESDHVEMAGFAVLRSYRTELDGGTSYFPLRQIVMSAVQLCDSRSGNGGGGGIRSVDLAAAAADEDGVVEIFASEEDGACSAVERLVSSRVLTASDMVALGLVLPELGRTGEASRLMATLQGQSPASLAKSVADALLKVLAPLQPLTMLWEGDGELDPCTKSVLSEVMKSARDRCPRMLVAIESRRPVTLPYDLLDEAREIRLTALQKEETEIFLRSALSLDREDGTTDISEKLLDTVHDRSAGCPLFIDRLAAWSVEREMIRRDTDRDVVVLSLPPSARGDDSGHGHGNGHGHAAHFRSSSSDFNEGSGVVVEEVDEATDTVIETSAHHDACEEQDYDADANALPSDLSDMVLEGFNDLPPHLWDAMKMAACIGPAFNADDYESLRPSCHSGIPGMNCDENADGPSFMDRVRELEASHGVFERRDGGGRSSGRYKWKRREVFEAVSSVVISNERRELHGAIVDGFSDFDEPSGDENANDDEKPTDEEAPSTGQSSEQRIRKRPGSVLLARHSALASRWDVAFSHYTAAGASAEVMMKFTEAEGMYRKAIVCWEEAAKGQCGDGAENSTIGDGEYLSANIKLGNCLRELAQFKEAEEVLTTCLQVASEARKLSGDEKPQDDGKDEADPGKEEDEETFLHALASLARLHQNQSKYVQAQDLYEQALPIARSKKESQPGPWLAGHIAGYAEILRKSGELKRAEELHLEALELRQSSAAAKADGEAEGGNSTELELAVSYTQLGCTVSALGRPKEAQEYHNRALASRLSHLGLTHALVSESLNYCAEALHKLGRSREGVALGAHAVRIRRKAFGPGHPAYAHALSVLASCYHGVGRSCDAQALLEECIGVCERAFSADHANMIPNLMAYGEVLRSLNKNGRAKGIYERAASIHRKNFKNGQRANQLEKCESNIAELDGLMSVKLSLSSSGQEDETVGSRDDATVDSASTCRSLPCRRGGVRVPIPDVDSDAGSTGTPILVLTDIGENPQDEYLLVLLAALKQVNLLHPLGVVANLEPQRQRASLARGVLDALGLPDVPVGTGSPCCCSDEEEMGKASIYDTDYARSCSCNAESGVALMVRALTSSQDGSVQLLCAASLTDVSTLIKNHEELFVKKVKEVTIMGSLKPLDSFNFVSPVEEFGHKRDMRAAEHVYEKCQELGIPTLTLGQAIAGGCPFSSSIIEDLSKTEHMVSTSIRKNCETSMNSLWKEANIMPPDISSPKVSERRGNRKRGERGINALWKNMPFSDKNEEQQPLRRDRKWFCQKFFGAEDSPHDARSPIWSSVEKMEVCNSLALLSCVATYRDTRFQWETKHVDGTPHRLAGESGIVCSDALPQELSMLLQLAFQSAMQNMC